MRTTRTNEGIERALYTQAKRNEVLRRDNFECRYCGSPAEHVDHVNPVSFSHDNSTENLVAACTWCNLHAGSKVFESFEEKRDWLRTTYAKRRVGARIAIWTIDETRALGRTLRTEVESKALVVENAEGAARAAEHCRALGMFPVWR